MHFRIVCSCAEMFFVFRVKNHSLNEKVDKHSYRFICHCLWLRYDRVSFPTTIYVHNNNKRINKNEKNSNIEIDRRKRKHKKNEGKKKNRSVSVHKNKNKNAISILLLRLFLNDFMCFVLVRVFSSFLLSSFTWISFFLVTYNYCLYNCSDWQWAEHDGGCIFIDVCCVDFTISSIKEYGSKVKKVNENSRNEKWNDNILIRFW